MSIAIILLYCHSLLHWLHWFLNRCALSHMTPTSYLVDVASDYIVHMILTSYVVGVAYNHTVYHFECYNSSLLWETCITHNTTLPHIPFECYTLDRSLFMNFWLGFVTISDSCAFKKCIILYGIKCFK